MKACVEAALGSGWRCARKIKIVRMVTGVIMRTTPKNYSRGKVVRDYSQNMHIVRIVFGNAGGPLLLAKQEFTAMYSMCYSVIF